MLYGKLENADIPKIAKAASILIVGNIPLSQLREIKRKNSEIILLKYFHALGIYRNSPLWHELVRSEKNFAHDVRSGDRLVARSYGWYLLNVANKSWRKFLKRRILTETPSIFDGVFLDDYWSHLVPKFVTAERRIPGEPNLNFIENWKQNLLSFLRDIKSIYPGLVFVNGECEEWLHYADGCMVESFVHSNSKPVNKFNSPSYVMRSLAKVERLERSGKIILVQSGGYGASSKDLNTQFLFCYAAFLLVSAKNCYFSFQPGKSYQFSKECLFEAYNLDLGSPRGGYYILRQDPLSSNLVAPQYFSRGSPRGPRTRELISVSKGDRLSTFYIPLKNADNSGLEGFLEDLTPVREPSEYLIYARCRIRVSHPNVMHNKGIRLIARFYDKTKRKLPGCCNLRILYLNENWEPYESLCETPLGACYVRLTVCPIGKLTGEAILSNVYFGRAVKRSIVLSRYFENGIVLLNCGKKGATLKFDQLPIKKLKVGAVTIGPRQGLIMNRTRVLSEENR